MLSLPPTVRLFVSTVPLDMRKSFDGLASAVRRVVGADPLSGHLFVFFNRSKDMCKILWWDRNGYALFAKRLERSRFHVPTMLQPGATHYEMDATELALILDGIDLAGARRRPRWSPKGAVMSVIR